MGYVYADIELINTGDFELARRNFIQPEEIKRMTVNMLVDSGAYNLCINEVIQQQLDLPFIEERKAELADGSIGAFNLVGPVNLRFKNRKTVCNALVLPGSSEPLMGAIPLEDMDVLIDAKRGELIVHPDHPNYPQMKVK